MRHYGQAGLPGTLCPTSHTWLSIFPCLAGRKGSGTASLQKEQLEGATSSPFPVTASGDTGVSQDTQQSRLRGRNWGEERASTFPRKKMP